MNSFTEYSKNGDNMDDNQKNLSMQELTMQVSGICRKDGQKYAFVTFADGKRTAEGKIPDCKIISQSGFEENEIGQLELFMKINLDKLKRKAASIDPLRAMLGSAKGKDQK
ncbi:MAG: hypothetical protein K6E85_14550 [Lachnospiraceae bacterium]|nr:hypothetical protein [Lachnospiraceae bacterium]